MDRFEKAIDVIKNINRNRKGELEDYKLVTSICSYFDSVRNKQLTQGDLQFLKYISSIIGIPHYYDLLNKFDINTELEEIGLNTLSSFICDSTLYTDEESQLHKYQKRVLEYFKKEQLNRFFLSASTSFGKTHLVYEIVKKIDYNNILLIFPTIALLSENLERIISDNKFENYKLHTLSDVREIADKNLFIYTPERYLSFIENNRLNLKMNFSFVDEIYKIDNDYIVDETTRENERDVAYRLAVHHLLLYNTDILLAGPYIDFPKENQNRSFFNFLEANYITLLDFNDFEIVNKKIDEIHKKGDSIKDDELIFTVNSKNKKHMCVDIVQGILNSKESAIIYCSERKDVDGVYSYTQSIISSGLMSQHDYSTYNDFINHITHIYHKDWRLVQALKCGIGIHHGLVPKYIQKEIISLFNARKIQVLVSTTTITEGVNTSAKYLIVTKAKKGNKELKKFDAKNIAGRAGRFNQHYSGRVIVLQNDFIQKINASSDPIKHKNYDKSSIKEEIDLFYTQQIFLSENDIDRINKIVYQQNIREIPEYIFNLYKVIDRSDKMKIYDGIKSFSEQQHNAIQDLIEYSIKFKKIKYEGFQYILDCIEPIVKNPRLKMLISIRINGYSNLTKLIYAFLNNGLHGLISYKINNGETPDNAIKTSTDLVYNTIKYQVVKYLGAFNVMYKYFISSRRKQNFDDVLGLEKLLLKLEHNAISEEARIVSDYGAPASIVDYYETDSQYQKNNLKASFDNYENEIFNKVQKLVSKK